MVFRFRAPSRGRREGAVQGLKYHTQFAKPKPIKPVHTMQKEQVIGKQEIAGMAVVPHATGHQDSCIFVACPVAVILRVGIGGKETAKY